MPRSIWKGVMSFGMVAIPVRLYLATESSSKVSFNLLCPEHRSRIKNKRYCVEGDHEVAWGDVVRGYEYEKGNYVELTDEDLEKLPLHIVRSRVLPCTADVGDLIFWNTTAAVFIPSTIRWSGRFSGQPAPGVSAFTLLFASGSPGHSHCFVRR